MPFVLASLLQPPVPLPLVPLSIPRGATGTPFVVPRIVPAPPFSASLHLQAPVKGMNLIRKVKLRSVSFVVPSVEPLSRPVFLPTARAPATLIVVPYPSLGPPASPPAIVSSARPGSVACLSLQLPFTSVLVSVSTSPV